jgi:HlyD family secretion protein
VQVDETDVPELALGDSAEVEIDAFPGETFTGRITEIGNSAIRPPSSQLQGANPGQQAAIDFEVVITLDEPPVILRPDLSATADIVTDTRTGALAIPIIAVTVRPAADTLPENRGKARDRGGFVLFGRRPPEPAVRAGAVRAGEDEVEGAFRVNDGVVTFVPVRTGIAGDEYLEVLSGIAPGDTVVAGPYTVVRDLASGDRIRPLEGGES